MLNKIQIIKIRTYRSILSSKPFDCFRAYYEDINSLPISTNNWKSICKCKKLHKAQKVLEINVILVTKTQLNSLLLDHNYNILETLFNDEAPIVCISNNKIELIGRRQQGRALIVVRGNLCKIAIST